MRMPTSMSRWHSYYRHILTKKSKKTSKSLWEKYFLNKGLRKRGQAPLHSIVACYFEHKSLTGPPAFLWPAHPERPLRRPARITTLQLATIKLLMFERMLNKHSSRLDLTVKPCVCCLSFMPSQRFMGFSEHYGIKHANMYQWINSLRNYSSNSEVSTTQVLKKKTPPRSTSNAQPTMRKVLYSTGLTEWLCWQACGGVRYYFWQLLKK